MGRKMGWDQTRVELVFALFDSRYWNRALSSWSVELRERDIQGTYGQCLSDKKLILIRPSKHDTDYQLKATLLHEMAHAATSLDHDEQWREEMVRLRSLGAPFDALDFLVPYEPMCKLVSGFRDAAKTPGLTFDEAVSYSFHQEHQDYFGYPPRGEEGAERLRICRQAFRDERRRILARARRAKSRQISCD